MSLINLFVAALQFIPILSTYVHIFSQYLVSIGASLRGVQVQGMFAIKQINT
jgi:hypothetical protein